MPRPIRTLVAAVGIALASGAALADDTRGGDLDFARVVHVEPLRRPVGGSEPVREYVTQMPYDPGKRIQVRVDVTPTTG